MTCEGYETRLTWGSAAAQETTPKAGVLLNPVRLSRLQQKSVRARAENGETGSSEACVDGGVVVVEADHMQGVQGGSPDCGLDFVQLQYGPSTPSSVQTAPDEDISKRLMDECACARSS